MNSRTIGMALLILALGGLEVFGCRSHKKASEALIVEQNAGNDGVGCDYILVERVGGGDKLFAMAPNGSDSIDAEFVRYAFKDTTFVVGLSFAELGDSLKTTLVGIFQGTQPILEADTLRSAGGFMMGSWLKCQTVKDSLKTVITDVRAKEALTEIERYIVSKMERKE